jgi:hypothetical protein
VITVVNKHHNGQGEYIGRPSPLGNPLKVNSAGGLYKRGETIALYETWLLEQIERLEPAVCAGRSDAEKVERLALELHNHKHQHAKPHRRQTIPTNLQRAQRRGQATRPRTDAGRLHQTRVLGRDPSRLVEQEKTQLRKNHHATQRRTAIAKPKHARANRGQPRNLEHCGLFTKHGRC